MAKKQNNVRLSEAAMAKLAALLKVYQSRTIVIELAIAALYRLEFGEKENDNESA